MLVLIAGVFCMLLAFSSMWLSWYVLMPHKRIHLPGGDVLGDTVGGTVSEIITEEITSIAPHKTSKK